MPCGAYKSPSYGGRYNPNYGKGIHSGNAWKLTTVKGAQWAAMKRAENGGGCPKKPAEPQLDAEMKTRLEEAQATGQGITKPELLCALSGKTELTAAERNTLAHFAKNKELDGKRTFARQPTRNIALQLAQGMSIAQASAKYGFSL